MGRERIFERDRYRCVYCGQVFAGEELTVDHLQPRIRGGDRSDGNLVTACKGCNVRKGHRRLAAFLADDAGARRNFFRYATAAWPRHLRAIEDELERDRQSSRGGRARGPIPRRGSKP